VEKPLKNRAQTQTEGEQVHLAFVDVLASQLMGEGDSTMVQLAREEAEEGTRMLDAAAKRP
jgi:hypothetical protein